MAKALFEFVKYADDFTCEGHASPLHKRRCDKPVLHEELHDAVKFWQLLFQN